MAPLLRASSSFPSIADACYDGSSMRFHRNPTVTLKMCHFPLRRVRGQYADGRSPVHLKWTCFKIMSMTDPCGSGQELEEDECQRQDWHDIVSDPLEEFKFRFMKFKKHNYLENEDHYQKLAESQSPKFMVIACADSRVCPSKILDFQPGEAFTVRNVANLVPQYQHGASETSAALEFAVNSLEVENILVVGHSRCGGIRALMSMKQKSDSKSFIRDWVSIAKSARLSTEAAAGNLSFEKQCTHCEKEGENNYTILLDVHLEHQQHIVYPYMAVYTLVVVELNSQESVNSSLLNLLTYPWIEKRVTERVLSLHGGYYDFTNCSFEKWTLVYRGNLEGGSKFAIRNCETWS